MMSKFNLIKPKPVTQTRASLSIAAFNASRRYFEAFIGLITMGVLIIPILYYPGLSIVVIFAEVYLIDVIYARIYGARVKMSLPPERRKNTRKSPIGMFDGVSVVKGTGFALLNR
ncbi:MAG: hypothetical protein ACFFAX_09890 [Promethearchaeota archaeon]